MQTLLELPVNLNSRANSKNALNDLSYRRVSRPSISSRTFGSSSTTVGS